MKTYYPVFLDLADRLAVVVGEGKEVTARATAFLAAGARVRVVCREPDARLRQLADMGRVELRHRGHATGDLEGATIALAIAGGSAELVRAEATGLGVPLCVVDDPARCDWIHGSVVRRGRLVVAISTSGVAPALAVRLKERIAEELGPEYGWFLEIAAQLRGRMAASGLTLAERRELWYRIVDTSLVALRSGDAQRVRDELAEELEALVGEATERPALVG